MEENFFYINNHMTARLEFFLSEIDSLEELALADDTYQIYTRR